MRWSVFECVFVLVILLSADAYNNKQNKTKQNAIVDSRGDSYAILRIRRIGRTAKFSSTAARSPHVFLILRK